MSKKHTDDDPAVLERLGANINARRVQLGLSQGDLAGSAEIDRTYVSQVENGRKSVTISMLARISKALSTTPSALTQGIMSDGAEEAEHQGA